MIDSYFRSPYQRLCVDPLAARIPANANLITLLACFFGVLTLPLLQVSAWLAAGALLVSGYLDTLDGTIARAQGRTSPAGAALDILCDRVVECAVVIGLFLVDPARAVLCLAMLASILLCVTSFLVVGVFSANESEKSFHYSPGLIERCEAFLFFLAMMLLPKLFTPLAALFTLLVTLTAVIRMRQFMSCCDRRNPHRRSTQAIRVERD